MPVHVISVKSGRKEEMIDITGEVISFFRTAEVDNGICYVFTPHTTAAVTINENADPDVQNDFIKGLKSLKLEAVDFSHMEGNSPAHIKSSFVGCSEFIIIENGRLMLGTWQGIYFCEFDGPRNRQVYVTIK